MRTKTLLATLVAAALGAPLGALAHDQSASPGASTQSSSGNGRLAQSESCGDSAKSNCPQGTPTPSGSSSADSSSADSSSVQNGSSDEQSAQGDSSSDGQLAQNDTDSSLTAEPSDPQSTSPYGSTGDASTRNS